MEISLNIFGRGTRTVIWNIRGDVERVASIKPYLKAPHSNIKVITPTTKGIYNGAFNNWECRIIGAIPEMIKIVSVLYRFSGAALKNLAVSVDLLKRTIPREVVIDPVETTRQPEREDIVRPAW